MTTTKAESKTCSACGEQSEQRILTSTSAFGSMDLDTRPPRVERFTIDTWIQRCPSCGYCASEIDELEQGAPQVVSSNAYRNQLNSSDFPDLANSFLCLSMMHEEASDYASGGWDSIRAAWACDDAADEIRADSTYRRANIDLAAEKCRKRALILLRKAQGARQSFAEQAGGEEALIADLQRRVGEFDQALKVCHDGLKKSPDDIIGRVLKFQIRLINSGDFACHVVPEAGDTGNNS